MSKPHQTDHRQNDLFKSRLSEQLNPKNPLYILSQVIDWKGFEEAFGEHYQARKGQPPKPIRLMVGLLMLEHMFGVSDEQVVEIWTENPYWQFFCGYDYLQWEMPIHPSSLTRWRGRLKAEGMEKILSATIQTSVLVGHTKTKDLQEVIVDTTVQEKAIAHPVDSRLLNKAREQLVKMAKEQGLMLRQTYTRLGTQALYQAARYGHAGHFKRMKKQVKKLKVYLGRVVRDIERKAGTITPALDDLLNKSKQLLSQTKTSKYKLYSLHAPETECIAKGKAHKRYEFGCKVALVITHKQGLALSSEAVHGNPYDGHTLKQSIENAQKLSGAQIIRSFADLGYKGHGLTDSEVILARRKGLKPALKRALKRRNAIEPHIGHMKTEGKLGRNWLKGHLGDQLNAILSAVGHNLRLLKAYLKLFFVFLRILFSTRFYTFLLPNPH